jgi:hypothetical protein
MYILQKMAAEVASWVDGKLAAHKSAVQKDDACAPVPDGETPKRGG